MKAVKKQIRQTARDQMKSARTEKKVEKKTIRSYDKSGGFIFEGQKSQAKKNVKEAFKRKKDTIKSVKKVLLKNN